MNQTLESSSVSEDSGDEKPEVTKLHQTPRKVSQPTHPVNRMLKVDISQVTSCITGYTSLNGMGVHSPSPSSSSQSSIMSPPGFGSQSLGPSTHILSDPFRSTDTVHELPADMLQIGWRKFWSKREGRHYYFNKNTNESLWEVPTATQRRTSDPLGITSPVTPSNPSEPQTGFAWPPSMKRSMSEGQSEQPMPKRLSTSGVIGPLAGPWSLETPNNSVIFERPPSLLHHPHPEVELLRGQLIAKLRSLYLEMCKSRANIEAPKESLNRWLMERKLTDKGSDPLFPSCCSNEMSQSLYQEIMNDVPVKLFRPKFSGEARKQLTRYAEAAEKMIDQSSMTPESRKIVKWNVEDTYQWIRKKMNASFDEYQERLRHMRQQCQPLLTESAKPSVQGICVKIYSLACEDAKRVNDRIHEIIAEEKLKEITHLPKMKNSNPRKVYSYPVDMIQPFPLKCSPAVVACVDKATGMTHVRFKNDSLPIKTLYLQKLEHLYRLNIKGDQAIQESLLLPRVYCLLKRYQSLMGNSAQGEGHCHQISLSLPTFDCLRRDFEVSFECFASPLNCFFKQYCSAFSDTDSYFGSRGSFLDFHPISGSFVCHPPVQEDLMESTVNHIERCLNNSSDDPLSFVVCLPDFKTSDQQTACKAVTSIQSSKFKRESFTLQAFQHEFKTGFQHVLTQETVIKSSHPTLVVILQNDAGFLKWGPTPDRVDNLIDSFSPGKQLNSSSRSSSSSDNQVSLLSPPPTPLSAITSSSVQSSSSSQINNNTKTEDITTTTSIQSKEELNVSTSS